MNIVFKKPIFKRKAYISGSTKNINFNLYDIKINNINKISDKNNAYRLNIYINNEDINRIKEVDDIALNFFINKGKARSKDLENLIIKVKSKVFEKTGIKLELELEIIGDSL